jgi:sugar phosphate permease
VSRPVTSNPIGGLPGFLIPRLPFYYGWIVLACVACAGFARQGPAVATLSIFVEPMTSEFGWSRTALSGAVSLGGVLAAIFSPVIGPMMDRRGPKLILILAVLSTGVLLISLSFIHSLVMFYLLYCIARMNFAGPFDLGIYGAVYNWFVARRALATSIATFAQMVGLVSLPLIANTAMQYGDWRTSWIVVGSAVLIIGFVPTWLLMVRRPEDAGLAADPIYAVATGADGTSGGVGGAAAALTPVAEVAFTRAEAMRTPSFWLIALFTLLIYPVQAGVSLHQAPHLIERGLDPTIAATIVSTFSFMSAMSGLFYGSLTRRIGIRLGLVLVAIILCLSSLLMLAIDRASIGYLAAGFYGIGIGGLLTALPLAWVETFGRASFGAIRGVALSVQVVAQAAGPLISGILRDATGTYTLSLETFATMAGLALLAALAIRPAVPPTEKAR